MSELEGEEAGYGPRTSSLSLCNSPSCQSTATAFNAAGGKKSPRPPSMGYESSFRVWRPRTPAPHRDLSREVSDAALGAFNHAKRRPAVQLILGTVKHVVECGTDFSTSE